MVSINWSLLQPTDVGGAFQSGFARGRTQSALSALVTDPSNTGAMSALAQYEPGLALQFGREGERRQDRARQDQFRQSALAAFNPETGEMSAPAVRQAYMGAGDVEGLMQFEQGQASASAARSKTAQEQMLTVAKLLDDAKDPQSYAIARSAAGSMGLDLASVPETYDPAWVAQQRAIVAALGDEQKMTTFQQNAISAGIEPGTDAYRQAFLNSIAPSGFTYGSGPAASPPATLTDDDFNDGGPSPSGSGGFPGQ